MMPFNHKKRPNLSESPNPTRPVKRIMRAQGSGSNADDRTPVFETSITMAPAFDAFPEKLRTRLETEHKKAIDAHMRLLERGRENTLTPRYTFSVVTGECNSRTPGGFKLKPRKYSFSNISFANMCLLRRFMHAYTMPLKHQKFFELETQKGLSNKDFVHMHSVRPGEVGWGFDTNRCLSLYLVELDGATLKKKIFYVEREVVKVELDVDVEVVSLSDS